MSQNKLFLLEWFVTGMLEYDEENIQNWGETKMLFQGKAFVSCKWVKIFNLIRNKIKIR